MARNDKNGLGGVPLYKKPRLPRGESAEMNFAVTGCPVYLVLMVKIRHVLGFRGRFRGQVLGFCSLLCGLNWFTIACGWFPILFLTFSGIN